MFDQEISNETMSWFDKSKASYANIRGDETFMFPLGPIAAVWHSCLSKGKAIGILK